MKKFGFISLAICTLFTLGACTQNKKESSSSSSTQKSSSISSSATTTASQSTTDSTSPTSATTASSTTNTSTSTVSSTIDSPDKAIDHLKQQLNNSDDIEYVALTDTPKTDEAGAYYEIKLMSKSIIKQGGSGTVGIYKVYQDGTYKLAY